MLRVYLVDDEEPARWVLTHFLEKMPEIEIIGEQGDPVKAIADINRLKPDLVFLDVQMPVLTGFELLPYLTSDPMIVFCTAYDDYAIQAFEEHALDYLVKPVDQQRLEKSLARAQNEWDKLRRLNSETAPEQGLEKIVCSVGDSHKLIWVKDILMFRKTDRYTAIFTRDRFSLLTDLTIEYLENAIENPAFARISRSCLVHWDMVESYNRAASGTLEVQLINGEMEAVSRRRARAFQTWIKDH